MRYTLFALIFVSLCGCGTSTSPEAGASKSATQVLYFNAGQYSPSQGMLSTLLDVLAGRPEAVDLRQIDTDQDPELTSVHRITAIPTLVILQDGEETGRLVGRTSHPQLDSFFHRTLL